MNRPFHMIIVGMTACGKTHYLLKILEENYMNHFDFIVIICPTFKYNKTYQNWNYLDDSEVFPIVCEHDEVENKLQSVAKIARGSNTLIILDDCAASQTVKNRTLMLIRIKTKKF